MRLRDIIGLIIALLLAVGVAFLTRIFLTHEEKPKQESASKAVQLKKILIARRAMPDGERVKSGDLVWQEWPQAGINSNYIIEGSVNVQDLIDAVVRSDLSQGEPVTLQDLVKPGERSVLSAIVAPGKRAISIDVTPATASSGLIAPGDFVDVVLSITVSGEKQQQGKSQTILSNVKVVAIDTNLAAPEQKPKDPPHVATLEVTANQAEVLMAGAKEGTLSLSLHSLEKAADVTTQSEENSQENLNQTKSIILMRGKEKTTIEVQG